MKAMKPGKFLKTMKAALKAKKNKRFVKTMKAALKATLEAFMSGGAEGGAGP